MNDMVIFVLENVDELASEVTKALEVVDDVAHVVEHASKKVEEETDKVQRFITEHKVIYMLN